MTNSSAVRIDRAHARDVDRIAELFHADMQDLGVESEVAQQRALVQAALSGDGSTTWVRVARVADGRVIGVILANVALSVKFGGRTLWIEELYVDPGARQGGVGRMLVEHMLEWAAEHGIVGVDLEAYRMNTGASILYRSLGFDRLPRERYAFAMADYLPANEKGPS